MFRGHTADTILMNPHNKMHTKQVLELKKARHHFEFDISLHINKRTM